MAALTILGLSSSTSRGLPQSGSSMMLGGLDDSTEPQLSVVPQLVVGMA